MISSLFQILFATLIVGYVVYSEAMFFTLVYKMIRSSFDKKYAEKQPVLWKEYYSIECVLYLTLLWLPIKLINS